MSSKITFHRCILDYEVSSHTSPVLRKTVLSTVLTVVEIFADESNKIISMEGLFVEH
jgi:hypothetical protein